MEALIVVALVLYLPFAIGSALLVRRRAPAPSAWVALVPVLDIVALADLTGITHSHRFGATTEHSAKAEMDRNASRDRPLGPPI